MNTKWKGRIQGGQHSSQRPWCSLPPGAVARHAEVSAALNVERHEVEAKLLVRLFEEVIRDLQVTRSKKIISFSKYSVSFS